MDITQRSLISNLMPNLTSKALKPLVYWAIALLLLKYCSICQILPGQVEMWPNGQSTMTSDTGSRMAEKPKSKSTKQSQN